MYVLIYLTVLYIRYNSGTWGSCYHGMAHRQPTVGCPSDLFLCSMITVMAVKVRTLRNLTQGSELRRIR